jgi:TorA maturation chaperone TorD
MTDSFCGIAEAPLTEEEQGRADMYALIARLLYAPPDAALVDALADSPPLNSLQPDNPLDLAWEKLVLTAGILDEFAIREEFDALFISISTPQINPYASLYLAGFMNEKPLAALRTELAQLGLERLRGAVELEDHLAALCEVMRLMITGAHGGKRQSLRRQKLFCEKYITSWHARCMDDIRRANGARFYRQVADFVEAFFSIESQAFDMEEVLN